MNAPKNELSDFIVNATTACIPGKSHLYAAEQIAAGIDQRPWGRLAHGQVQLCPQNFGILDEVTIDQVSAALPGAQLRLHATVRTMREKFLGDDTWLSERSLPYYRRMAELSKYMRAPAYTFHAGTRAGGSFADCVKMAFDLEDLFGIPVGIEGQYPALTAYHVATWDEYRALMESGAKYAVDVSHLNIVARGGKEVDLGLLLDMMSNPNCIEIHVSDNPGDSDRHWMVKPNSTPWWMESLRTAAKANPAAPIFTESWRDWPTTISAPRPSARGLNDY